MSDIPSESVLVVPTRVFHAAGHFQGFTDQVSRYLPGLLDPANLQFRPRAEVETDPAFKQLIPYVVLRHGEKVFHYTRGQKAGERRLRALRSLGVGGHISAEDASAADPYRTGLLREVTEEVYLDSAYTERLVGLINDDATSVGQVHLGVVHIFDLQSPAVRRREAVLTGEGFAPLAQLREKRGEFETWSQFLLDWLCEG